MRLPRLRWLLLALVVVAALTATAALLALPRLARPLAVWQLRALTGRPVAIEALDLRLATGRFDVRGVRVTDHDGGLLAEFERLEGRFRPGSLLRGHLWIETVTLTNPHARIVRTGPNRFNVSDLLERPASSSSGIGITIDRFAVAGGAVAFEDRVLQPVRTWRADDLRVEVRHASTLDRQGTAVASTTIAGALVSALVEDLQLGPVHLRARVNVRDLDLRLLALYLPADGPVTLERGVVDASVTFVQDAQDGTALDADAVVRGLALRRPGLEGDAVATPELQILAREVRLRAGSIGLRYASLGGDVTVLDPTTSPPRPRTFSDVTVTASGIDQLAAGSAQIAVHANLPGGGEVDVGGPIALTPRRADVRVRARRVELAPLAPYLPLPGRLAGIGTADVRIVATQDRTFGLAVTGDVAVERLALGDDARTLAGAARVAVNGLAYTWPATVRAAQLTLTRPVVTVERDAAGAIGLVALLRRPGAAEAPTAPPPAGAPGAAVNVAIGRLAIEDGSAVVTDAASGGRVEVTRIAFTGQDVGWPGAGTARVRLSAAVAGGEVTVNGTVDGAPRRAELAVKVRGADLATAQAWLPIAGRVRGAADADLAVTVGLEPFALTLRGALGAADWALLDGRGPVVSVARVDATGIDAQWPARLAIDEVRVQAPVALLERDAGGRLSLAALVARRGAPAAAPTPGGPAAPAAQISVRDARVDNGRLVVTDAASGGRLEADRVALQAGDVTWPGRGPARVRLSAAVAGGEVTARGTVDAAQRRGELALTVRAVDLTALQPWLPIAGRIRGAADADVTVAMALEPFALTLRGGLGAGDLVFADATRPLLTVTRVDATGVDLQWPTRLAIDRLRVNTPWAQIARNPAGDLTLRTLFARPPGQPAAALPAGGDTTGPVPGLHVSVREAAFENGGASIVDDSVEPAARFELRGTRLDLRNLTWPARGAATLQLSTPMPGHGTLKAKGTLTIEPTRLQLETELDQVDLAPGRPYLPFDARLRGRLSGRVKVDGTFGETIKLEIGGDATVDRLALGDAERRLATVQRIELGGLRYQYPATTRIRQLTLRKPWLLLERRSDGAFELVSLFAAKRGAATPPRAAGPGAAPASAPATAAPVRVTLDALRMEDGFVRFVDRTTTPDFAEELSAITLAADGLGTRAGRRAKVTLRGTLPTGAPLSVQGDVGAILGPRSFDLTVSTREYPVPRANPYLAGLGWAARQGTLTATLRYRLNGDDLEAANDVILNGLEVERAGAGGEVRGRVGLPLDTLVSLLKDRQGNIRLNVPVHGRLSAPEFDYGEAVWGAVRNLAIRLIALPFSLVGKLFFTEDSRIEAVSVDPVTFETARAAPTTAGAAHLDKLAVFLREASAINLRLRPVTTVADVTALRRAALNERLAALGADAAARRQAAIGLYIELFPRRQPPPTDEALYDELTRETPTPARALRTLATERVAATRNALIRAGIAAGRLAPLESRAAVESEGAARVEFEITR